MGKKQILLVDDEPMILRVLDRVIKMSIDCDTVMVESAREALALLEKRPFDVIVSDMKMPGMDGADFLNVVRELYPQTARLVFSARADNELGMRTAKTVHQYFMKPMDINFVAERIDRVLRLREFLPEEGMENIVAKINSLPGLPGIYTELEQAIRDPKVSVEEVGRIFEQDMFMSMKVLQLVNSAFFGLREHITRPAHAVKLLGLNVVKGLFLATHIFTEWRQSAEGFSIEDLSTHSLTVAKASQAIARFEHLEASAIEEYYIAGLFHDIGKLVIATNMPESHACVAKAMTEQTLSRTSAERNIMGATHAETGAYLLALWGFSDDVVEATAFHHNPGQSAKHGLSPVAAVHVANCVAAEGTADTIHEPLDHKYLEQEGLWERVPQWIQVCDIARAGH